MGCCRARAWAKTEKFSWNSDQEGDRTLVSGLLVEYLGKAGQPWQTFSNQMMCMDENGQNWYGLSHKGPPLTGVQHSHSRAGSKQEQGTLWTKLVSLVFRLFPSEVRPPMPSVKKNGRNTACTLKCMIKWPDDYTPSLCPWLVAIAVTKGSLSRSTVFCCQGNSTNLFLVREHQ